MPKKKITEVDGATYSRVAEQTNTTQRARLAEACSALDPEEERALAEEDLRANRASWPEY